MLSHGGGIILNILPFYRSHGIEIEFFVYEVAEIFIFVILVLIW